MNVGSRCDLFGGSIISIGITSRFMIELLF